MKAAPSSTPRETLRLGRRRQFRSARLQIRLEGDGADPRRAPVAAQTMPHFPHSLDLTALDGRILVKGRASRSASSRRRHARLRPDASVEPRLGRVRLRASSARACRRPPTAPARTSSRTPCSVLLHAQPRRLPRRSAPQARALQGRAQGVLVRLIEHGYHSLFFPGGTRSRSGGVERRLKLGLAGTGIEAFARTAEQGTDAACLLRARRQSTTFSPWKPRR